MSAAVPLDALPRRLRPVLERAVADHVALPGDRRGRADEAFAWCVLLIVLFTVAEALAPKHPRAAKRVRERARASSPGFVVSVVAKVAHFPAGTANDAASALSLASSRMTDLQGSGRRELGAVVHVRGPRGAILHRRLTETPGGSLYWIDLLPAPPGGEP